MFTHPFHPDRFLRSVYGTAPFMDYCRERRIPFEQAEGPTPKTPDVRRWAAALAELPHEQHAQIELELATVNEMSGADAIQHLIEACEEGHAPPDSLPAGAPLALWFFLHHPVFFHEVFLHHEIQEVASWRTARAPAHLALADLDGAAAALERALRAFFRLQEGAGRFCSVDAQWLTDAFCFIVRIADRLQFLDTFTEDGRPIKRRLRPAIPGLFVYYPNDGLVLLKSHLRSHARTADLFHQFADTVLGSPISCNDDAFHLDLLKRPFHPLPDAEDMELIRVKALHLRYPEHARRRQVKLETLVNDGPDAIDRLLQTHVAAAHLPELRVSHAELQVRLRGVRGSKNYPIRLWPNRCNLSQTPLGSRFLDCLKRWGLHHGQ